jgi:hypothetical protein
VSTSGPAETTVASGPSVAATAASSGTAAGGVPLPTTRTVGSRRSSPAPVSISSSASWPPVRIAAASAPIATGSAHPSYTHRGPSTECCMVVTSASSAPASGAAR